MPTDDRPTAKQQRYLRTLAQSTGTSFTPPTTKTEASREIKRLKQLAASPRHERREERRTVSEDLAAGPSSSPRPEEIQGYGSNCRWAR